ncbi:MAG TPA: SGNH/GDSL hydrolase family protein [Planctomycetota bacterium]|nr:SGNH/GDSL hydrolase family protein [Planctomycetota bacterium]
MNLIRWIVPVVLGAGWAPSGLAGSGSEIAVKEGERIAFLGDSITQGGMGPTGYVSLVIHGLKTSGVSATAIGAGISGHKSNDMLSRLQKDVLDKKPQWMTLSCGVNDVWHGERGVPLDQYKRNITEIVEKTQAAGIKVMILSSTMITENPKEANNQKLAAYNDFLRDLAREKKCLFADLNAAMQKSLDDLEKAGKKRGTLLTSDGVHMNPWGNQMMAEGILRAFGLDDEAAAKARSAWLDIPGGFTLNASARITLRQYQVLEAVAAREGKSVQALLQSAMDRDVEELLKK